MAMAADDLGNTPMRVPEEGEWRSPAEDPEGAQAAIRAFTRESEDPPEIEDPPDTAVTLPGGIHGPSGLEREAEVRELNGADEEAIFKPVNLQDAFRFADAILDRGTVRVGSESATPALLGSLLMADRETLTLAIRRVTYGSIVELDVTCGGCGTAQDVRYDLDAVPVKEVDERRFTIDLPRGGPAEVRLATGGDQQMLASMKGASISEMNTALITRVLESLGDDQEISRERVLRMPLMDRRHLIREFAERATALGWMR